MAKGLKSQLHKLENGSLGTQNPHKSQTGMAAWPPVNTSTQKEEARDPGDKLAAYIGLIL